MPMTVLVLLWSVNISSSLFGLFGHGHVTGPSGGQHRHLSHVTWLDLWPVFQFWSLCAYSLHPTLEKTTQAHCNGWQLQATAAPSLFQSFFMWWLVWVVGSRQQATLMFGSWFPSSQCRAHTSLVHFHLQFPIYKGWQFFWSLISWCQSLLLLLGQR